MRGGPVADRRLDPAALHPTATFVDGWLQARPFDWLAQVGTAALDPRRGYASALIAPLGHATVVGDHFHAIRLANAVTDQARRQVKQVTLGHRGRTYDPPYRIRKLLVTAAEQLTERGRARLRARDTMRIERGADRSASLDSTRWPLSWGSVTVPNHVSMRTRSSPAMSKFRNPPGSPRDATDVTGVATPAAGRDTRPERGGALSPPLWVTGRGSSTDSSSFALRSEGPGRWGLSSCRTTPFARCRWPG
jgi:hypothetical protein